MIDKNQFSNIVSLVIDNLEGGYYNPKMLQDGRVKDSRYNTSGETMFGIDRRQGGSINTSPAGQQFWSIIDKSGAANTWRWNYMGGSLEPQLKSLVADMMYPQVEGLARTYLTPDTLAIVEKDPRLIFHFAYGAWNGSGWFRKFAQDMNKAVASGVKDPDKLAQVAIDSRTKEGLTSGSPPNSLVAQGGRKIAQLFLTLKDKVVSLAKKKSDNDNSNNGGIDS